ncbi:UNVERIFIED_CONTAM: hypothetical protein FKN15_075473 [Acipenser sinensis]
MLCHEGSWDPPPDAAVETRAARMTLRTVGAKPPCILYLISDEVNVTNPSVHPTFSLTSHSQTTLFCIIRALALMLCHEGSWDPPPDAAVEKRAARMTLRTVGAKPPCILYLISDEENVTNPSVHD